MSSEIFYQPVSALADALASKKLSSVELTQAVIERTKAVDDRVLAFNSYDADDALAQARSSDARRAAGQTRGPLAGIPVGLKEVISAAGPPLPAPPVSLK